MLTDLNHVKKDIDNGLRIISKNSKFRFEIYDNEFIRFLLKNAVLFKIFSLNKFKPNNSPIVSDEFLLLTKYFSLGDYNSFVITERTAVECLMKLNLNDQLEDTTTNLINSCSFDFDEKSIITEFYKINSKIVHRSKVNDTSINTYILNMYNADNNFSPNGRKK